MRLAINSLKAAVAQRKRGSKEKILKAAKSAKTVPEPEGESDAESDGYGEDGLSWEAVLATVQVLLGFSTQYRCSKPLMMQ